MDEEGMFPTQPQQMINPPSAKAVLHQNVPSAIPKQCTASCMTSVSKRLASDKDIKQNLWY